MTTQTFTFQTEVSRLLDIVAGSLYSHKEIFLRELISNASDACDKLRYAALTKPELIDDGASGDFRIALAVDAKAKTLSVSDNGIGMNRQDLIDTLGTIARSGTGAFVDALSGDAKKDLPLIGQFGVGFYSAFMVADKVEVLTRKAGEAEAWVWTSDGKGAFEISDGARGARGTTVTLHMKKDAKEFLEKERLKHIVKTYSDHIGFPIVLEEVKDAKGDGDGDGDESAPLNAASALWTRPKSEITEEQYKEFYHHSSHSFDDPWLTLHNRVEGVLSYTNLLFIPSTPPFDLFQPERKGHLKLYVNRVFITEDCEGLVPSWLRFLRGVVDSEDLSLNISREILQNDPKLAKISSGLVKRVLGELKKKAEKTPQDYADFWKNFGAVLKEGLYEDYARRDELLALSRFKSTAGDAWVSLEDYVQRMKEGQDAIYYITGENPEQLAKSPHLEGYRAKGVEVLLLSDPIDDFWVSAVGKFKDKDFKSITKGAADLDKVKGADGKDDGSQDDAGTAPGMDRLIVAVKAVLGDAVSDVRVSKRLTDSAVCLVADEGAMDVNLERMLKRHGQMTGGMSGKILEINPKHPLIEKLASRAENAAAQDTEEAEKAEKDATLDDAAHLLFDQAKIAEGEIPDDPQAFARRLSAMMALGV
ncbi:molecular chaperone HtpG [Varunaivibrio sulfuroxidans]|uniref:Chaperone protein HtpG n=1 Tax=Varunaivibrio sulfuroxidans TaxID=1773489 RepID=A0A4R3JDZ7_9PROT|nr:molecular chaperone HtpG [Varunaivibrio sulfuroxidans]TCS63655.1 molecular chaperone HtpG [Varunaivibrio sulfuroxidans]WES30207.1 molecular chaperone HtpG [Varunaivibrio sulfuroxidans]